MKYIGIFFVFFILIYFVLILYKKIGKKKYSDYSTINVIVKKNKLKLNEAKYNRLLQIVLILISIIMAVPLSFAFYSQFNFFLTLLISLGAFIILIIIAYLGLSYYLRKKGW